MAGNEGREGLRTQGRHVAVDDEDIAAEARQRRCGAPHRVARAALFGLEDETGGRAVAVLLAGGLNLLRLVTHDDDQAIR